MKKTGARRRIKKAGRKNIILKLCLLAVCGSAAVALLDMHAEITTRRQQVEAMRKQNVAQSMLNKDLRRRIEAGLDDETIEYLARERFGYAYPDEIIFIDISGS
jgi:cell division protein FtsB